MKDLLEVAAELLGWEWLGTAVIVLVIVSVFVEIVPVKWCPWTWLARKIGRAINGEVLAEVEALKQDIAGTRKEVEDMKEAEDERDAKAARTRILRFGDECLCDNVRHTKEHFDQVLRDITDYENYCDTHPNFENDQATETIIFLKETYRHCLKNRSFREHKFPGGSVCEKCAEQVRTVDM